VSEGIEFLKRFLRARAGADPKSVESALRDVPPSEIAEKALTGDLVDGPGLFEAAGAWAGELDEAGSVVQAENVRFGMAVVERGRADALQLWHALIAQDQERASGRERSLDAYLGESADLKPSTAMDILAETDRTRIVCPDCGRSEIVPTGAASERSACPDCSGRMERENPDDSASPASTDPADPLAGQIIGGCRLEKKLGAGGMGYVYKARHIALNKPVAIKFLSETMSNETAQRRFLKEARAAARLEHGNIVAVHDTGVDGGKHYIVMQFVEGESVSERLKRDGALPLGEALNICIHAGRGIAAAHRIHIIHRDIKPDNIMIDNNGEVKVADFGLAKDLGDESAMTLSQQAMGTPHYMSPEQAEDAKTADVRADVYSFGATLYAMIAGTPPFTGTSPWAIISKHQQEAVPDIRDRNPDVPEVLWASIRKMMEKDPADRFQTMEEVYESLSRILRGIETDAPASLASMPSFEKLSRDIDLKTPATNIPRHEDGKPFPLLLAGGAVLGAALVLVVVLALAGVFSGSGGSGGDGGDGANAGAPLDAGPAGTPEDEPGRGPPEADLEAEAERSLQALLAAVNGLVLNDRFAEALARLDAFPSRFEGTSAGGRIPAEKRRVLNLALPDFRMRIHQMEKSLREDRFEEARKEADAIGAALEGVREGWRGACPESVSRMEKDVARSSGTIRKRLEQRAWLDALDGRLEALDASAEEDVLDRLAELMDVPSKAVSAPAASLRNRLLARRDARARESAEASFRQADGKARALLAEGDVDGALALYGAFLESPSRRVEEQARAGRKRAAALGAEKKQLARAEARAQRALASGTVSGLEEAGRAIDPFRASAFSYIQKKASDVLARLEKKGDEIRASVENRGCAVVPAFSGSLGSGDPDDNNPVETTDQPAFTIGIHEVTCREYETFVSETGHPPPPAWKGRAAPAGLENHPVTWVTLEDVRAYTAWLGKKLGMTVRLPTEREWEIAAGFDGTELARYPWGNAFHPGFANLSGGRTAPVGSHLEDRSPSGLFDMAGNAAEFCLSCREDATHVIRGGSCDDRGREQAARVSFRQIVLENERFPSVGFRVVMEPPAGGKKK